MTEHGETARFYSTTKFAELVGQAWARANDVTGWKQLGETTRAIEPILLTVEEKQRADGSTYLLAVGVEKTSNLDDVLEGNA